MLTGKASWNIKVNQDAGEIVFDTRDLEIRKVTLGDPEKLTTFTLGKNDDFLGKPLTVKLFPVDLKHSLMEGVQAALLHPLHK